MIAGPNDKHSVVVPPGKTHGANGSATDPGENLRRIPMR
jgi:hypothetical protein